MFNPQVLTIGFLILISLILTSTSIFTKSWINTTFTYSDHTDSVKSGIIPYHSNSPTWLAACCWMMYISLGLFFPLILVWAHIVYKNYHHACCHCMRHHFNTISLLSALITILQAITFILMASKVPHSYGTADVYDTTILGYSAYLAVASAVVIGVVMAFAGYVPRRRCDKVISNGVYCS